VALPTVPTAAASRALAGVQANTTATRATGNLTGLTKNSGDLLIAIFVAYQTSIGTNAAFSGWTAGWTEFADFATSTTMPIGAAYKRSTGSETGTVTATQAATITGHAAWFLLSISVVHPTSNPEAGGYNSGTTTAANATTVTPSWASDDALWIAVAGNGATAAGTFDGITAAPPNYTNMLDSGVSSTSTGGVEGAVAFRALTAASEDVGAFTVDVSSARSSALTIAVRGGNWVSGTFPSRFYPAQWYPQSPLPPAVAATATVAAKGTVTAAAVRTPVGAATLGAKGAVTATATRVQPGAATLAARGTLTAAAAVTKAAAATLAAKGTLAAAAIPARAGAAASPPPRPARPWSLPGSPRKAPSPRPRRARPWSLPGSPRKAPSPRPGSASRSGPRPWPRRARSPRPRRGSRSGPRP
jgi:hypothetical protein